jgi:exosome complex component RRP46
LLVTESEGSFTLDEWNTVYEHAKRICCGGGDIDAMRDTGEEDIGGMTQFVKTTLQEKVGAELHWR